MSNMIQWSRAQYWEKCWNPMIGCKPLPGQCDNCYAHAMANRFHMSFEPHLTAQVIPPRKGVVFCGNMTDLFAAWNIVGSKNAMEFIRRTMDNEAATYLWLTKRPYNLAYVLANGTYYPKCDPLFNVPFSAGNLRNQYFGFTAVDEDTYRRGNDGLVHRVTTWANTWVSFEPLLDEIEPDPHFACQYRWFVVGCESGPKRRPCKIEWVEKIVEYALDHDIPVFVKQLDLGGKCVTDIRKFPKHLQIRQVPWRVTNTKGGAK